ncbi:hypoxanthine phosphoribosyltransferase [Gloeobacter kilaueensis]|uniref:Hypoxanthine phosphoribosyltransferase n=1 Tax=Gloeobacter kilaueensis (strain ATCC BAA-2537 / CCAP 1431/1 / ULC 316 / JS1) TaxID=1183438 RepID=U5QKV5_GLOK1|nr:hypoxanthine phosphoribosyltransferase [Gloeobacter kilaueensis]AGY58249.1 hypoxanthine phosphoribosyltransferase [Gloeobacter kilaueensis JS1]
MNKVLYSEEEIALQVQQLAAQISDYYAPRVSIAEPLVLLPVLKGAFIFSADLVRQLTVPVRVEFLRASSYRSGTVSGALELDIPGASALRGQHLLILEDIIDTGKTVSQILMALRACEPASLQICALLDKPARRVSAIELAFCGLTIAGDRFVIGYGMDLAERYRELPYVGEIDTCTF